MPGIDPSILAAIGNTQMAGGPAVMPGAGGGAAAPDEPKPEPVALHDACKAAYEAVQAACDALEDLAAQAQMATDMDPSLEKKITEASAQLDDISDTMEECEAAFGEKRAAHDSEVSGKKSPGAGGGPPKGPPSSAS